MVLATQNPIELEGTYPLPEAQLDRFMVKLLMRPGGVDQLQAIVRRTTSPELASVNKVCGRDELAAMTQAADRVALPDSLLRTVCRLTMATHSDAGEAPDAVRQYVRYGSSPRGAQSVVRLARVAAIAAGRGEVTHDDIEAVAPDALRHRLILNFEGQSRGVDIDEIVREVVRAAVR
jgi:MoxR-like ATPase